MGSLAFPSEIANGIGIFPKWNGKSSNLANLTKCMMHELWLSGCLVTLHAGTEEVAISNNNAFQWDAYHPLVDRIPACNGQGDVCLGGCLPRGGVSAAQRGVCLRECLPGGVCPGDVYTGGCAQGGICLGGVSAWGRGVCPGGVSAQGVSAWGRVSVLPWADRHL